MRRSGCRSAWTLVGPALCFLLVFSIEGCATSSTGNLTSVYELPNASRFTKKPSVYFLLFYSYGGADTSRPGEGLIDAYDMVYKRMVMRISEESRLFAPAIFDDRKAKDAEYVIHLALVQRHHGFEILWRVVSAITLCILPATQSESLELSAIVYDRDRKALNSFKVTDGIRTWQWLPLIPWSNSADDVRDKTLENMIRNLFQKILDSKVLKYESIAK